MTQAPATHANTNEAQALQHLRDAIDAIDAQLITLLQERCKVVKQVGALKAQRGVQRYFMRPGREAQQIRKVAAAFMNEGFAPQAAVAIWRAIISASIALEEPLKLSLYSQTPHSATTALAQEFFGSWTPCVAHPSPKRVLADLAEGTATLGILSKPQWEETQPWWPLLWSNTQDSVHIVAGLPAFSAQQSAWVLAPGQPEPSGQDRSVYLMRAASKISISKLEGALKPFHSAPHWLGYCQDGQQHLWLAELDGFYDSTAAHYHAAATALNADHIELFFAGAYACPLSLTEKS